MKLNVMILMVVLAAAVLADISIISPTEGDYVNEGVQLDIEADDIMDSISYSLNGEDEVLLCEDCSSIGKELNLAAGDYTLEAVGVLDDETYTDEVEFTMVSDFSVEIKKPDEDTYDTEDIYVKVVADVIVDELKLKVDDELMTLCEDCSTASTTLNLDEGEHTLKAYGFVGDVAKTDKVQFTIDTDDSFDLDVLSPKDKTYSTTSIRVKVESDEELDEIQYRLNDGSFKTMCEDCDSAVETIEADEGENELRVRGYLDGERKVVTVDFEVDTDDDEDDDSEGRYTEGYNKLPQMLVNGEIDDEELAEIMRENYINPGIINRLIKTGMLEEESIDAILETQFTPPGIFKKIFGFFGLGAPSYAEMIYDNYDLSSEAKQKILKKDMLPKGQMDKLKDEMKNSFNKGSSERGKAKSNNGKSYNAGKQNGKK